MKHKYFIALIIFLNVAFSQPADSDNFFSAANREKFEKYLYCTKDFIRASSELKSYLRLQSNDTVRFQMAKSLQKLERYSESADYFKTLFFSDFSEQAKTEFFRSKYLGGNTSDFYFNSEIESYLPKNNSDQIHRLEIFSRMLHQNSFTDSSALINAFPDSLHDRILTFFVRKNKPEYKSPVKAALMSSILPGLGKIYADQIGDGITALLVTGLFSFLAYDNFNADHQIRGWIFAGLAAYFYAGNIYGSAAAAQYYNAGVRFNFENDVRIFLNEQNLFLNEYDFWCR